ncbi:MAG TPA: homoserine kinase [Nitrososphaera sp.]|nr:homoserine kinase [Nitrososphaera sp.]
MVVKSVTAVAPCSTANLGPGYDVFGLALDALEDKVRITMKPGGSGKITIKSSDKAIPSVAESNSAGLVVRRMMLDFNIHDNIEVQITKRVPPGYGMGSSAASAVAAAVAFDALYKLKIDKNKLVEYAAEGEIASAGIKHYDNVAASLLGGFVIASKGRFIRIAPPKDLFLVVAVPLSMPVPEKKTEVARSVIPKEVPLKNVVHNVSGASTIVAGFALKDVEMIARGIDDIIVEPARKRLIPGYDAVKHNGISAGALAVTISGAGPSMIAFLRTCRNTKKVASAMSKGFLEAGVKSKTFTCRPSSGARLA